MGHLLQADHCTSRLRAFNFRDPPHESPSRLHGFVLSWTRTAAGPKGYGAWCRGMSPMGTLLSSSEALRTLPPHISEETFADISR